MSRIVSLVCADLEQREQRGVATYGTTMDRTDLSRQQWLQHLYEELLDAALYMKKLIEEEKP